MKLEQIIELAIPITDKDCRLSKQKKEALRIKTKQRIDQYIESLRNDASRKEHTTS